MTKVTYTNEFGKEIEKYFDFDPEGFHFYTRVLVNPGNKNVTFKTLSPQKPRVEDKKYGE